MSSWKSWFFLWLTSALHLPFVVMHYRIISIIYAALLLSLCPVVSVALVKCMTNRNDEITTIIIIEGTNTNTQRSSFISNLRVLKLYFFSSSIKHTNNSSIWQVTAQSITLPYCLLVAVIVVLVMDMENVKQIFRDAGTAISRAVQVNNNNNNFIDFSNLILIRSCLSLICTTNIWWS